MSIRTRSELGPSTTREYSAELVQGILLRGDSSEKVCLTATFVPSFGIEAALRLARGSSTTIEAKFSFFSRSLWGALSEREYERAPRGYLRQIGDLSHLGPIPVQIHEVQSCLDSNSLDGAAFDLLLREVEEAARSVEPGIRLDGMQVLLTAQKEGCKAQTFVWSPEEGHQIHACLAKLHAISRSCFPDEPSRSVLDHLEGYLYIGFPSEVDPENRVIRLYGSFTSRDESELLEHLGLAADSWVIDVCNVEVVAGSLHAPLRVWVAKHPRVSWRHRELNSGLLDAIGVPLRQRLLTD